MQDIFLDFNAKEIRVPTMCCSNLKRYKEYELKVDTDSDERKYIIQGTNLIEGYYSETYSDIQVLKDIIDIGEFLENTFPKYNYMSLSEKEIQSISSKLIKWCSKYGILYGEGINHSESSIYVYTFINYIVTMYQKFEVWVYISDISISENEGIQYANKIFQSSYETLEEIKDIIYPLDIKNDITNTELMFMPNLKNPVHFCNTIAKVIDLQFLFLTLSNEGIKNDNEQTIKINQCCSCQNYFATFNAKIKYCKYCNDPKIRAVARQQKSRAKKKKEKEL